MKQCSKCEIWKDKNKFYKQSDTRDKLRSQCKECISIYRTSKRGRESNKRYYQTQKGRRSRRKSDQKRNRTEARKQQRREAAQQYAQKHPRRYKARVAIKAAKNRGELPRASLLPCKHCGGQAKSYHHHKGYSAKHQLNVIPLCKQCHIIADKETVQ